MKKETLIAAVEHNQICHYQAMKAWPKAAVYDEDDLLSTRCRIHSAVFNVCLRTRATTDEALEKIAAVKAYAATAGTGVLWFTGPESKPEGLGDLLVSQGFKLVELAPGMAIDLAKLPRPGKAGITIEAIRDPDSLAPWKSIVRDSFGLQDFEVDGFASFYKALGLGPDSPAQHFLGLIEGEPVGAATVFLGAGAAGIYNIATLKAWRGKGVGKQMTLTALAFGRKKGFCVGVLQATETGYPLYSKLGFEEVCKIGVYRYDPA